MDVVIGQTITLLYVKAADDPFFCTIAVALLHCGEIVFLHRIFFILVRVLDFWRITWKMSILQERGANFFNFPMCSFNDIQGLLLAAADEAKKAAPLVSIRPTNHRAAFWTEMVILCRTTLVVNSMVFNEVFDLKQKAFSHARAVFSYCCRHPLINLFSVCGHTQWWSNNSGNIWSSATPYNGHFPCKLPSIQ